MNTETVSLDLLDMVGEVSLPASVGSDNSTDTGLAVALPTMNGCNTLGC